MLWRYKRGAARAGLGQTEAALADLRAATLPEAPSWVSGRAHTELARLSLARGDRQSAASQAARAESLCTTGNDPACVEQARSLLKQAGTRMAGKVKTWVWIVIAIVAVGMLGLVAMAGVGFYFASQHIDTRRASPANAAKEFEAVRARFTGQPPLIELDDHGRFVRIQHRSQGSRAGQGSRTPQRPRLRC